MRVIDGVPDNQGRWEIARITTGSTNARVGVLYRCDLSGGDIVLQLPRADATTAGGRLGLSLVNGGPSSIVTMIPNGTDKIQGLIGETDIGATVWLALVIVSAMGDWWVESGGPIL
jgi:hypothetical protein